MYGWLDVALDNGISEFDFWEMTLAEIERVLRSQQRVAKERRREKAMYDYTLANLIGRSVARIYNSANTMPNISEVYPGLFDAQEEEEETQRRKDELSALRFKLFTQSYNSKFKEGENKTNE